METVVLKVGGMTCGGCALSVERALEAVGGVDKVRVSLEKKEASVQGRGLDVPTLQLALEDAGYELLS